MKIPGSIVLTVSLAAFSVLTACSTAPSAADRQAFKSEALESRALFERELPALSAQLKESAGYAVFPGVGQWGIIFGGGQFGRGAVFSPDGTQEGWAAVTNPSVGLQLGGQGLQLLIVFQTKQRFDEFKANVLAGSAGGTAVGGVAGTSAVAAYSHGVAVYVTGQKGMMAGASVGLQYLRYKSMADAEAEDKK